jgi:hypothetical protein
MDNRGQMLLLAALVVCVCLALLASYLTSIKEADSAERSWSGSKVMENVLWAQDSGLEHIARAAGNETWDRRFDLGEVFKNGADRLTGDISRDLLARGFAFSFQYNDSLASYYVAGKGDATLTDCGGILIKKSGNEARICGCAYDVSMTDGSAQYRLSRVVLWG